MSAKENYHLAGDGDTFSSLIYSSGSGSTLFGGVENCVTAPATGYFKSVGYDLTTSII